MLFRCQGKSFVPGKARQDIRRPGRPLAPAGQSRRTEAAHEIAAVALSLPIRDRAFALGFQGLEQFLLAATAMKNSFRIVGSKRKPVFHLVGNLVLITNPAGQDLAGQSLLDEVLAEPAAQCAFFTAPFSGHIGL